MEIGIQRFAVLLPVEQKSDIASRTAEHQDAASEGNALMSLQGCRCAPGTAETGLARKTSGKKAANQTLLSDEPKMSNKTRDPREGVIFNYNAHSGFK
jgi:hypothetical protein